MDSRLTPSKMEISKELMLEIVEAWSGPVPLLPLEWKTGKHIEAREMFFAFSGKQWDEVQCGDIPQYFMSLNFFGGTNRGRWLEAGAYYFASFMKCYFTVDLVTQMGLVMDISLYLDNLTNYPYFNCFSVPQLQVVDRFLQEATLVETYDPEVTARWHQLVERVSAGVVD